MARNPKIEAILTAWWESEHCERTKRAEAENALNRLLDGVVNESQGQFTRDQILDNLFSAYKDYRIEKRRNEQVQIARSAKK
jgi:hypothetical protein